MQTTATRAAPTERPKLKALAYRALGRLLSCDPLDAVAQIEDVASCLDVLAWRDTSAAARCSLAAFVTAPDDARAQYSRVFHRSLPPPYETTYTSGGGVSDLADIAGFYHAFGMAVQGEKADHVAAELEFLAYLLVKEVHAIDQRQPAHEAVSRDARIKFLAAHAGTWLPLFAAQIEKVSPGDAYSHLVRAAHLAISADAGELGFTLPEPTAYAAALANMPGPAASPDRPFCEPPEDDGTDSEYDPAERT